jgi:hypothetical protein
MILKINEKLESFSRNITQAEAAWKAVPPTILGPE